MERVEDIIIVGAGIAGLTTALGLHRMGIRSLVLESWSELRMSGQALGTWTNAWKALDALGIGDALRLNHFSLQSFMILSAESGLPISEMSYKVKAKHGDHEIRCLIRKVLLETLAKELPQGTIRFNSKLVAIEEGNHFKTVHLADGSILKAKVLIGCDGVNSVVAKSLGHRKPSFTGRIGIRGIAEFPDGHSFEPKLRQFVGNGFRSGFVPCNQNTMYWFFTYTLSHDKPEEEQDPSKIKEFVLQNVGNIPEALISVVERTSLDTITSSTLRFRPPIDVLWPGGIYKENVCVAGDALHAMTPDLGQGGCAALEDGVVLARYLAEVFQTKQSQERVADEEEYNRIMNALRKYADERRWRSFELISMAYTSGRVFQSKGKIISFLREKVLSRYMPGLLLKRAEYDCGKLTAF